MRGDFDKPKSKGFPSFANQFLTNSKEKKKMTRRENNQLLINAKVMFITMAMLLGVFFVGATNTSAATVKLSNVNVPKYGNKYSKSFKVSNKGTFTVKVRLRTNTLLGYGGNSKFRVQLMKGTQVLVTKYRTVSSSYKNVYLTYTVPSCAKTGYYRIRFRNVSGDNPQAGTANIPPFNVPSLTPKTRTLSMFGVVQGQTINRDIPSYAEPTGTGGQLKITATWDGICLPDTKGCKLTFRLRRNGSTKKTDIGYSHSSLLAGSSEKMTIYYNVPASQVSGNWDLRITGSSKANVNNVKTKVRFTPKCQ